MNYTLHIAYSMLASWFTIPSFGSEGYQCESVNPSDWISKVEVVEQLSADGWQIRKASQEAGCWKVVGSAPDGRRVKVHLHPSTGEVQTVTQYGSVIYRK